MFERTKSLSHVTQFAQRGVEQCSIYRDDILVSTERACAWTVGGLLDDRQFEQLRREAQSTFAPFVDASGRVAFEMPALMITAART